MLHKSISDRSTVVSDKSIEANQIGSRANLSSKNDISGNVVGTYANLKAANKVSLGTLGDRSTVEAKEVYIRESVGTYARINAISNIVIGGSIAPRVTLTSQDGSVDIGGNIGNYSNINSKKSVIIKGNVDERCTINSDNTVIITGDVGERCTINCVGDPVIEGNIGSRVTINKKSASPEESGDLIVDGNLNITAIGSQVIISGNRIKKSQVSIQPDVKDHNPEVHDLDLALAISDSLKTVPKAVDSKQQDVKDNNHKDQDDAEMKAAIAESLKFATKKLVAEPEAVKVIAENKDDGYSHLVKDYLAKYQDNRKISELIKNLNLSEEETAAIDLSDYSDPITENVIEIPVCLNERYYDITTIPTFKLQDPFIQGEPGKFSLNQITTGRNLLKQLDKQIEEIKRKRLEKQGVAQNAASMFSNVSPPGGLKVENDVNGNNLNFNGKI